jgi:hypothetical protein
MQPDGDPAEGFGAAPVWEDENPIFIPTSYLRFF